MKARIRHIAIVSDQYALLGRFYEAIFGMRAAEDKRPERAVTVSDGYVGLNINPRKPGRPAGLDHFGLEVDDADEACARLGKFPGAHFVKRPGTRPFAGISANDPSGNVFDISQKDMSNRASVYVEEERASPRAISHLAMRTLNVDTLKKFYSEVFGLEATARGLFVHQMIGILPDRAREIYGIPEGYEAWTGIAIGYRGDPTSLPDPLRERERAPRQRKPLQEFVFNGKWGNPSPLVLKQ